MFYIQFNFQSSTFLNYFPQSLMDSIERITRRSFNSSFSQLTQVNKKKKCHRKLLIHNIHHVYRNNDLISLYLLPLPRL